MRLIRYSNQILKYSKLVSSLKFPYFHLAQFFSLTINFWNFLQNLWQEKSSKPPEGTHFTPAIFLLPKISESGYSRSWGKIGWGRKRIPIITIFVTCPRIFILTCKCVQYIFLIPSNQMNYFIDFHLKFDSNWSHLYLYHCYRHRPG